MLKRNEYFAISEKKYIISYYSTYSVWAISCLQAHQCLFVDELFIPRILIFLNNTRVYLYETLGFTNTKFCQ